MSSAKDIKKLVKELRRAGWEVLHGGRTHWKAYHPKGGMVTMSATPSCHHALRNIMGDINRLKHKHGEADFGTA